MSQREAFEAHILKLNPCTRLYRQSEAAGGAYRTITVERAWQQWQAAIQHARDVAERCRSAQTTYGETPLSIAHDRGVTACADAIKEALNTGVATPGNKGTTPNS